MNHFNLSQ